MVTVKQPCFILFPVAKLSEKCNWQPLKTELCSSDASSGVQTVHVHVRSLLLLFPTNLLILIQNNIHYIITLDIDWAIYCQHVAVIKTCFAHPSPGKMFLQIWTVGSEIWVVKSKHVKGFAYVLFCSCSKLTVRASCVLLAAWPQQAAAAHLHHLSSRWRLKGPKEIISSRSCKHSMTKWYSAQAEMYSTLNDLKQVLSE